MERNFLRIGLINVVILLLAGLAGFFLARYSHTLAGQVGSIFFGFGFLIAAVSYFQMRLEESERLEQLEFEEIRKKATPGSSLFEAQEDSFPAQRSREQFERIVSPIFAVLLFLGQGAAAWWAWQWAGKTVAAPLRAPMVAMALYGLFGLVLFLMGKYSAGRSRMEKKRLLRPSASYLLLGAYICFVVAGTLAAWLTGFPAIDLYVAKALAILVGLAAVETLISVIFEIYRPRVRGAQARLVYESRLIGLVAQPEGLITTAAQALDYQFGFKVSETWVYRFLERAFAWLILAQLGVLLLSSCFVFIGPGEQGLLERFGKPVAGHLLEPGLRLKLPWPIEKLYRYRTDEIQTVNIGFVHEEGKDEHGHERPSPAPSGDKKSTVLWTVSHYKEEFNLLVANRESLGAVKSGTNAVEQGAPVDLLTVSVPVQFQIKDVKAWAHHHTDAANLLEKLGTREVIRYLGGVDLFELMSSGRSGAAAELQRRIQAAADQFKLGVKIIFVGLQDIHPPVGVAAAFESVISARQEREARRLKAEGYAARTVEIAKAEAAKLTHEAHAYGQTKIAESAAKGAQFTHKMAAYAAAPDVFMQRAYLEAVSQTSTNSRKYVLATTNSQEVIILNLEDKVRRDLLDVPLPPSKK